jgi:carbon-monoxide dehydrogenase medium subunit
VIPTTFDYTAPDTLADAVRILAADPANVALAGGNGLITLLQRRELLPATVVDLRKLDVLRGMRLASGGRLWIGAMTTLTELTDDPRVRAAHGNGALGDVLAVTGDPQARNRATIGGTIASAAPGSDLAAALLVMDATLDVIGPDGSRVIKSDDIYSGTTSLDHGELITGVHVEPAEPGSAYVRLTERATMHALCGVAVTVALGMDGAVNRCRIATTGTSTRPARLTELERAVLATHPPISVPVPDASRFVDDALASGEYRRQMTSILAKRAFARAVDRARNA